MKRALVPCFAATVALWGILPACVSHRAGQTASGSTGAYSAAEPAAPADSSRVLRGSPVPTRRGPRSEQDPTELTPINLIDIPTLHGRISPVDWSLAEIGPEPLLQIVVSPGDTLRIRFDSTAWTCCTGAIESLAEGDSVALHGVRRNSHLDVSWIGSMKRGKEPPR